MSRVTNVLLCMICDEGREDSDAPDAPGRQVRDGINPWLATHGGGNGLVKVDHLFGGTKYAEVDVYGGAFNHLDESGLMGIVQAQRYDFPEEVEMYVKREESIRFEKIDLGGLLSTD